MHCGLKLYEIDAFNTYIHKHLNLFPMSSGASEERANERSRVRERSEQCGASECVSGVTERPSTLRVDFISFLPIGQRLEERKNWHLRSQNPEMRLISTSTKSERASQRANREMSEEERESESE